jgi:hypothetical protein
LVWLGCPSANEGSPFKMVLLVENVGSYKLSDAQSNGPSTCIELRKPKA